MSEPRVKSRHERTRVITEIVDRKTKAVQSEAKHSDINNIVAKAYKSGQLPVLVGRKPMPPMPDALSYQESLNRVVFAQQNFARLPSSVREQFDNKPERMLQAIELSSTNAQVREALVGMGILEKSAQPTPPAEQGAGASSASAEGGAAAGGNATLSAGE